MKIKVFLGLIFLIFSMFLYVSDMTAEYEPYTQLSLPEGAKTRLNKGWVREIAYSPDSTLLAVASSIGIWIYDAQTGEERNLLTGHLGPISSVEFSPDGQTLASGSGDNTIRLWDVDTGNPVRTLTGHTDAVWSVSFSPDSDTLSSGSSDGTILLWTLARAD